jgi:hypothetical protein
VEELRELLLLEEDEYELLLEELPQVVPGDEHA